MPVVLFDRRNSVFFCEFFVEPNIRSPSVYFESMPDTKWAIDVAFCFFLGFFIGRLLFAFRLKSCCAHFGSFRCADISANPQLQNVFTLCFGS